MQVNVHDLYNLQYATENTNHDDAIALIRHKTPYNKGMPITEEYSRLVIELISNMKNDDNYLKTEDFDVLNDRMSRLWRMMSDAEKLKIESIINKKPGSDIATGL